MKKNIILFFSLSFLLSWAVCIFTALLFPEMKILVLLGAWGPTISAILIAYKIGGSAQVKALLKKVTIWKMAPRFYFFAIFGVLIIGLIASGLNCLLTQQFPSIEMLVSGMGLKADDGILILLLAPVLFIVNTVLGGPIAEEVGWRGFAQDELSSLTTPTISGVIIGFLWAMWHIPLFYFMPDAVAGLPIHYYIVLLTSMGVWFAWLYTRSEGSIFLAILLHGGFNFTVGIIGAEALESISLLRFFVGLCVLIAILLSIQLRALD